MIGALVVALVGCGAKDSSESAAAAAIVGQWSIKALEGVPFTGTATVEYKADGTFVYHEAGLTAPTVDYGVCWMVQTGTYATSGSTVTITTKEQSGRDGCLADPGDFGPTDDTFSISGTTLTITTKDGTKTAHERNPGAAPLVYADVATIVKAHGPLAIDTAADSYVEDKNTNDNLTLLLTECNLDPGSSTTVTQYYSSAVIGDGRIIKSDFRLPTFEKWTNGKYSTADNSDSCGAPGLRILKTGDLQVARASNDFQALYGCGATCIYTITSEQHNADNKFTAINLNYECTNVGHNTLSSPGIYGLLVDKHIGKAKCPAQ